MLNEFSRQSDLQVLFDFNILKGMKTRGINGHYDTSNALRLMLQGTNLVFDYVNDRTLAVTPGTRKPWLQRQLSRLRELLRPPALNTGDGLEQVIVASSRDFTQSSVGSPLSALNRVDIDSAGFTNVPDLLRTLPQTFGGGPTDHTQLGREANTNSTFGTGLNLRGLDAGATLVLLDGRRLAGSGTAAEYVDVTSLPLSAIDHIDIIADGSSTRYGADAVAGVVNFVTRKNFTGRETQAGAGQASGGALRQRGISQLFGHDWDSGRGMIALEFDKRDALPAADRSQATNDLIPFGGNNFDQPYGNPGTIVVGSQTWAIPKGRPLVGSPLQPGTENVYGQRSGTDILPSQKRFSLTTDIRESFGNYAELWFASWLSTREAMEILSPGAQDTLVVPENNPYYLNPTGGTGPVEVPYGFGHDLGLLSTHIGVGSGNTAVGIHLEAAGWHLTGSLEYAFERGHQFTFNALDFNALSAALSSSNPLTAFNPFGNGSDTNPAALVQNLRTTLTSYCPNIRITLGERTILNNDDATAPADTPSDVRRLDQPPTVASDRIPASGEPTTQSPLG